MGTHYAPALLMRDGSVVVLSATYANFHYALKVALEEKDKAGAVRAAVVDRDDITKAFDRHYIDNSSVEAAKTATIF